MMREVEVPGEAALVTGAPEPDARAILACGYRMTLGAMEAEAASALVARNGPEGLLLSSDIGEGVMNPLLPARLVGAMERRGLSRAVMRRVAHDNAAAFYRV